MIDHDQIYERLKAIEKKLDTYIELNTQNHIDLKWVKGYVKTSIALFLTIIGALITAFINIFDGKH